jgi:high-affinity Fe2+/Pb2+ permease
MVRSILAIIAGYALFVAASLVYFRVTGRAPHAAATPGFIALTALYGAVSSFFAGLLTCWVSNKGSLKSNYFLAAIIAGFAAFSLFKSAGSHWTQLLAMFIFAPISISGGVFLFRKRRAWQSV